MHMWYQFASWLVSLSTVFCRDSVFGSKSGGQRSRALWRCSTRHALLGQTRCFNSTRHGCLRCFNLPMSADAVCMAWVVRVQVFSGALTLRLPESRWWHSGGIHKNACLIPWACMAFLRSALFPLSMHWIPRWCPLSVSKGAPLDSCMLPVCAKVGCLMVPAGSP